MVSLLMVVLLVMAGCVVMGDRKVAAVDTENLKPVELTWYYFGPDKKDNDMVFSAANEIIKEKINATVNFEVLGGGDYKKKMPLKIAAGERFDLCFTSSWRFKYKDQVSKGAFVELDGLIDEYAPELKELIPENIWDATRIKGKIYGVPNYQISARQFGLVFRKDLVDKYNLKDEIDKVEKIKDLTPILELIKENEPGVYVTNVKPYWHYRDRTWKEFYEPVEGIPAVVSKDHRVLSLLDDYFYQKELEDNLLSRKWNKAGFYHPDEGIKPETVKAAVDNGEFFLTGTVYKPGVEAELKSKFGYEVYVHPMGVPVLDVGSVTATLTAISRTSQNPERAMMFLNLVNTNKELYNLLAFGIEGEHYKKIGKDRIELIPDSGYQAFAWMLGNQFNAYKLPGQPDDVWEKTKEMNKNAYKSPLLGFSFDRSDPELKTIKANIDAIEDEYNRALDYGLIDDVEEFMQEYIRKLKKAGIEEYVAEIQKQLDAWKENK